MHQEGNLPKHRFHRIPTENYSVSVIRDARPDGQKMPCRLPYQYMHGSRVRNSGGHSGSRLGLYNKLMNTETGVVLY